MMDFSDVLSVALQAHLGWPVANLGVAGYGTMQELVVLQRDAVPLKPQVVIWFFFEGNDLYNDEEFENTLLAPGDVRATTWTTQASWPIMGTIRGRHRGEQDPEMLRRVTDE